MSEPPGRAHQPPQALRAGAPPAPTRRTPSSAIDAIGHWLARRQAATP